LHYRHTGVKDKEKLMAFKNRKLSPLWFYTGFGVAFGLLFPVISALIEIFLRGIPVSFSAFIQVQKENPLLWVIDSAPLFLGIVAWFAGTREQKLQEQANCLEDLVESRSQEVIRQKLFYEALFLNTPIAVVTLDKDHNILSVNPAFQKLFGYRQAEIMGKNLDALVANPAMPEETTAITKEVLSGKGVHVFGSRKRKDGQLVEVEIFGEPIQVNGSLIGALGLYRDITVEKQAKESLAASEERFRRMFTDSPVALRMEDLSKVKTWVDGKSEDVRVNFREYLNSHPEEVVKLYSLIEIIDFNSAALQLLNAVSKEELQGKLYSILSKESRSEAIEIICSLMEGTTSLERELIYTRLDGKKIYTITKLSVLHGYEKTWERVLFSNVDISVRKMVEERLSYISLHDIMTAVYNRAFFEEEIARYEKSRVRPISILVMDMDNLKVINDKQGHQAGDFALQYIANIIQSSFREEDVTARIGGDEFAVLLPGVGPEMAENAKGRILNGIEKFNKANSASAPLSLSIGCATANQNESLQEAFRLADQAMYLEKKAKKKIK
jgi:diguanylate cyclase (GGDEF)-like protein/PAS domain S-box-containing protein